MPWPKNHLPKYRKHRASGQAVVTLSGVDHYLGPHGTEASKREHDRIVEEWFANDGRLTLPATGAISMIKLRARFWKFAKLNL